VEALLKDPEFSHVHFDISWDEVAKYLVATPVTAKRAAELITRYPDRFVFGTDEVAPANQEKYLKIYDQYGPPVEPARQTNQRKASEGKLRADLR
jgi:hypothetical protein